MYRRNQTATRQSYVSTADNSYISRELNTFMNNTLSLLTSAEVKA